MIVVSYSPCFANFQTDGTKRIGSELRDIKLTDEFGKKFQLSEWKGKPFFIHPMFSSCKSTCPIMAKNLVESFGGLKDFGKDFNVLSLSFDPSENPKSLRKFRKEHHLPTGWSLAFGEESQIRSLMDSLDFRYVKTGEDFAHSNLVVLVDDQFKIRNYLYGVSISSSDLKSALLGLRNEQKDNTNKWMMILTGLFALVVLSLFVFIARVPQLILKKIFNSA